MPSLREAQRRITADILAFAQQSGEAPTSLSMLRAPGGVDLATRLDVYRHGYPSRILEALRDAYPATANILGEGSFTNLLRRYLASVELSSYNLNDVGAQLAEYCRGDSLSADLPFLTELVTLEWRILQAFQSREKLPIDPQALSTFDMEDWERAVLEFQPSVAIVSSDWPIRDLREAKDTEREEIDIELNDRPQTVLVHRDGFDVERRLVAGAEESALRMMLSGTPLGEAMVELDREGTDAEAVMAMFGAWVGAGIIAAISVQR